MNLRDTILNTSGIVSYLRGDILPAMQAGVDDGWYAYYKGPMDSVDNRFFNWTYFYSSIGPGALSTWNVAYNPPAPETLFTGQSPDKVCGVLFAGDGVAADYLSRSLPEGVDMRCWTVSFFHARIKDATITTPKVVAGRPLTESMTDDQFVVSFVAGSANTKWRLSVRAGNDPTGTDYIEWRSSEWTADNEFHFYTVSWNGSAVEFYRDGVLLATSLVHSTGGAANSLPTSAEEKMRSYASAQDDFRWFGPVINRADGNTPAFDTVIGAVGWLTDCALFSRALRADEVTAIWAARNTA